MITLTRKEMQQVPDALEDYEPNAAHKAIETLRSRLAEPEQEPVAWTIAGKITNWSQDFSSFKTKTYTRPVYAAPPQREWVGLTDEEIHRAYQAWFNSESKHERDFVRAIEVKLKEKNK